MKSEECCATDRAVHLYCPILVVSLAVAASSVSQSCYKSCIIQLANPEENSVPEHCNCSSLDALNTDLKKPSTPLDDTRVYFEPAEDSLFLSQLNARPFHISNPIKVVTKTKRSKVKESMSNKDFSYESTGLVKEETIIQIHLSEKQKISPTYLDLGAEDGISSNENFDKNSLFEDLKSTEQSLEKCLDFHVLNYSRKHGILENFKEYFEARNLKVYENVSDSDLTSLIQQYCRQSELIIEESLREILRQIPSKQAKVDVNNEQKVDSQQISTSKFVINDKIQTLTTSFVEIKVPRANSSLVYAEPVEPATTYDKTIEHLSGDINITDIEYSAYSLNSSANVDPIKRTEDKEEREKTIMRSFIGYSNDSLIDRISDVTDFTEITATINDSTNHTITTVSPEYFSETSNNYLIHRVPNVVDHITESTQKFYETSNFTTILQEDYINSATMFDLDTMPSEIFYTTYKETNKNSSKNGIHVEEITTTSPFSKYFSDNALEENYISSDDISTTTVSFTYSENRNVLNETEIIIPKIISKELNNNTVQSFIDGYEILPNSDFNEDSKNSTEQDEFLTDSKSAFETLSEEKYISGNLYFSSNQELVPVRLLQSDGGKINLAINGDTLCDKLIKNTNNKSRLLSTLCECIRKNMDQNNNSTILL